MNWQNIAGIIVGVLGLVVLIDGIPKRDVPRIVIGSSLLVVAIMTLTNWLS